MITVTILTKNGGKFLQKVLKSVECFDEVIILDTGSTDQTIEIAKAFSNVKVHTTSFNGFGPLHNFAAKLAKHDWILSIDSDEIVTQPLIEEILALEFDPNTVYSFPFHNFFNGKHIKWCGWYPDRHVRLYHKKQTSFSHDFVHEKVLTAGFKEVRLKNPIYHFSYHSISDFLRKMHTYSDLFAEQNRGKKRSSFATALLHGFFAFVKSYFLKRGILGGKEGYIISAYNSQTAFYKYLKLAELNRHAAHNSLPSDR